MRPSLRLLLLPALAATLACDGATGPETVTLTPGVSRTIASPRGADLVFRVMVPEGTGTLRVQLRDGEGDPDLYVRRGAPPEPNDHDCASEALDTLEECLIDAPAAGAWYVRVVAAEDFGAVRLQASLGDTPGAAALLDGVPVMNLGGAAGSFRLFAIQVPAGAVNLTVETEGPVGDVDLFVREAAFPLLNRHDCGSFDIGNDERCIIWGPDPGTWYVRLEGYEPYAGVTLRATITMPPAPPTAR